MKVLSWDSKHSTKLFDASTPEALREACRKILTEYRDDGWMWRPDDEPERPAVLDMSDEEIDQLPDAIRQATHETKTSVLRRYRDAKNQWDEEAKAWELLTDFLDNDNPDIDPWRDILADRNGYEYEDFQFLNVWTAEKDNA